MECEIYCITFKLACKRFLSAQVLNIIEMMKHGYCSMHTHTHTHVDIYIYVYLYVCVCPL